MLSWVLSIMFLGMAETPSQNYKVDFTDHPRLLFTQDDLPTIRERKDQFPWARQVYEAIRRNADAWLEREVTLPDRGSQWWHWYSCKKDGATLQTKSDTEHVCPVCGTVYTGYPYDDVVLARKHSALAEALWDCGFMYQMTGNERYAQKGREILLAYAEKYLTYPLHNIHGEAKVGGGRVGPQSLDESVWLITICQGADMIWDTLSREEVEQVAQKLFYPAAVEVIQKHRMGIHNIQCWKNSAVGLTGFLLGDPALVWDAIESEHGYRQQMAHGVRPGGPWFEGAWGYHFYTLRALWSLTEAAYHNGIDLYGPELKSMFDAPIDFAMPNLHLPAFNDSSEVDVSRQAALYEIAYARYGDPRYRGVLGKRRSKQALLYGRPLGGGAGAFSQTSRNYEDAGYAILTRGTGRDATWLCLDYGPHGGGHGHPDKLNFVLYARGQVIAPDPGTARYGVPIQREWFRQTIAHNTLTVDERSQNPTQGNCVSFDAEIPAVMLEAGSIYKGVQFYRTAALLGEDGVLIADQVFAQEAHLLDLAYHNYGVWTDTPSGEPWEAPQKPGYIHFQGTLTARASGTQEFRCRLGGDWHVRIHVLGAQDLQLIWGTGVGKNTQERVPMLVARRQGTRVSIAWLISLTDQTATLAWRPIPGVEHAEALQVTYGGQRTLWLLNPQRKTFSYQGRTIREPLTLLSE